MANRKLDEELADTMVNVRGIDHAKVKKLLDKGADANTRFNGNQPMLHAAIANGSLELTQLLIEHGAKVNTPDQWGDTALHNAGASTRSSNPEVMPYLISKGADLEALNKKGETPLLKAAMRGQLDAISVLIAHGANVNVKSSDGVTVAHMVADLGNQPGSLEILQALKEKGVDLAARDKDGKSPLDYARDSNVANEEVMKILTEAEESKKAMYAKILAKGPSPSQQQTDGTTDSPPPTPRVDNQISGPIAAR